MVSNLVHFCDNQRYPGHYVVAGEAEALASCPGLFGSVGYAMLVRVGVLKRLELIKQASSIKFRLFRYITTTR